MRWKTYMLVLLMSMPLVAAGFDDPISSSDKAMFDQILEPVMRVYNFVKYAGTVLAVVFLVFAGIQYIMSGADQAKREQAKMMATYIVIGLVIIWMAPMIVTYLTG